MLERADLLRVDATGMIHPLGKTASQALRARAGEWRLVEGPNDVILMRKAGNPSAPAPTLKLAGEIRTPGAMCDIVSLIAQASWRGELVVVDEGAVRSVYFADGSVLGVATNVPDERLGETLYRAGALTREQVNATLAATKTGKRFGETILELEFLKPEQLFPMMARQVEEVFYTLLQLSAGTFYFFDRFDEGAITHRHNLNVSGLLMEGVRRMDEMRFFRGEKGPERRLHPDPDQRREEAPRGPPRGLPPVRRQAQHRRHRPDDRAARVRGDARRLPADQRRLPDRGVAAAAGRRRHRHRLQSRARGGLHRVRDRRKSRRAARRAGAVRHRRRHLRPSLPRRRPARGWHASRPNRVARNLAALAGDDPDAWLNSAVCTSTSASRCSRPSRSCRATPKAKPQGRPVSEMLKLGASAGERRPDVHGPGRERPVAVRAQLVPG